MNPQVWSIEELENAYNASCEIIEYMEDWTDHGDEMDVNEFDEVLEKLIEIELRRNIEFDVDFQCYSGIDSQKCKQLIDKFNNRHA